MALITFHAGEARVFEVPKEKPKPKRSPAQIAQDILDGELARIRGLFRDDQLKLDQINTSKMANVDLDLANMTKRLSGPDRIHTTIPVVARGADANPYLMHEACSFVSGVDLDCPRISFDGFRFAFEVRADLEEDWHFCMHFLVDLIAKINAEIDAYNEKAPQILAQAFHDQVASVARSKSVMDSLKI